ncbi:MAG: arsenate reductase (glutaredoxin) [Alphaproteobacteria bacterium]
MGFKIFHNPRCSKSRKTLEIINEKEISIEIIEYLKTPPSCDTLRRIIDLLEVKPRDIMRTGESIYKEKDLSNDMLSDDELIDHMIEDPILIERPIVFDDQSAIIGRPPENVLKIISS